MGTEIIRSSSTGVAVGRATRGGDATLIGRVDGGYAWDLERAPDGTIYVAAGSPAAVYRLDLPSGELVAVRDLPAQNALDLVPDGRGGEMHIGSQIVN